jgi:hypothetical protein
LREQTAVLLEDGQGLVSNHQPPLGLGGEGEPARIDPLHQPVVQRSLDGTEEISIMRSQRAPPGSSARRHEAPSPIDR